MVRTKPSRALLATAFASVLLPDAASAALTFSSSTGKLSGTISDATIPSVTTVPAAAAQLGTVGYSTDGKLIYGPFEAGFGRSATATATRDTRPYPCESGGTYSGYCPGGIDVGTCEAGLFNSCPSGSVRTNLFMDECGGHANPYHYHTDMVCHYDPDAEGHSGLSAPCSTAAPCTVATRPPARRPATSTRAADTRDPCPRTSTGASPRTPAYTITTRRPSPLTSWDATAR